ncbi:hypothetical protein B0J13DRAFT_565932 [Dactylonectria estremocensis]|uniref:Uncharacterized protein n=1 Tax=Dactylonectria estremocensis TaxID=1079267 RepID=A0A9P9DTU2_9HYPO|nr:hypothetical protein B0J13DRAFT_565932 [Dactylonectria estremocensis]
MAHRGSQSSIGFPKSNALYSSHQKRYSSSEVANAVAKDGFNAAGYMNRSKIMNELHEEHIQRKIEDRFMHEPGYAAMMHGHEPSKGARIDAVIAREEAELLARKKKETSHLPGKKM